MVEGYLSWWLGAIALGLLTVVFRLLTGRTLGVSGSWRKIVFWRQERALDKAALTLREDQAGAANALMAATMAEFGDTAIKDLNGVTTDAVKSPAAKQAVPWTAHLVFLICLALGGLVWAVSTGNLHIQYDLGSIHNRISGSFGDMSFMLLVGGFLVGMGTQMAGGCSSGHGLSGCANLSWGSLLATAVFFSTAVIVANLINLVV